MIEEFTSYSQWEVSQHSLNYCLKVAAREDNESLLTVAKALNKKSPATEHFQKCYAFKSQAFTSTVNRNMLCLMSEVAI